MHQMYLKRRLWSFMNLIIIRFIEIMSRPSPKNYQKNTKKPTSQEFYTRQKTLGYFSLGEFCFSPGKFCFPGKINLIRPFQSTFALIWKHKKLFPCYSSQSVMF